VRSREVSASTQPSVSLHSPSLRGAFALARADALDPRPRLSRLSVERSDPRFFGSDTAYRLLQTTSLRRASTFNEQPILITRQWPTRCRTRMTRSPSLPTFAPFEATWLAQAAPFQGQRAMSHAKASEAHRPALQARRSVRAPKVTALRYTACGRCIDPVVACGGGRLKR
jgi:hypothetical protein